MTKKLWHAIGRGLFWLLWPLLIMYLARVERTRMLIVCGDEILLLRAWLGTKRWAMPGGGLHPDEAPRDGVIREVREETGLTINPADLKTLFSAPFRFRGFHYQCHYFAVVLPEKPPIKKQHLEIADAAWIHRRDLTIKNTNPDTLTTVTAWFEA